MVDAAAIAGSYSDFKLIKSRSVAQVIIELPIERAEAFLKAFGVPQPGAERPVALALLNVEQPKPEKPKQSWSSMNRAQQAGVLCADERFQQWICSWIAHGTDEAIEVAADQVRQCCGVESRRLLDKMESAGKKWDDLVSRYRQATGQATEVRG